MLRALSLVLLLLLSPLSMGLTFDLPKEGNIVGKVTVVQSKMGQSLGSIGQKNGVGLESMIAANQGVSFWQMNTSQPITIPAQFILPSGPREGIVINIAEMRLYYYHPDGKQVSTFPIGIGQEGWGTPISSGSVVSKVKDPTWNVPESIRRASLNSRNPLPKVVPPGPDNPLGKYALKLTIPGVLIHGTLAGNSIGRRSSHGCLRLWDEDIEYLYQNVPVGTKIRIIHEPYKIGFQGDILYLESHDPISDHAEDKSSQLITIAQKVAEMMRNKPYEIDWDKTEWMGKLETGLPTPIGHVSRQSPEESN